MEYKSIYSPVGALGGDSYEVFSNGEFCRLKRNDVTVAICELERWEEHAERWGAYEPYRVSPSWVNMLIEEIVEEDRQMNAFFD